MPSFDLPCTLTLPSGKRVTIRGGSNVPSTRSPKPDATDNTGRSLFADVIALFENEAVIIEHGKTPLSIFDDVVLRDFHVIRAVLTKARRVGEDEIEIDCHNCGAILVVRPCEGIEIAPWEDGEANDPDLDRTAELGVPLEIAAGIALGRVREARTVTLRDRTVRDAMPLFQALSKDPFVIDEAVVDAMGIVALGAVKDPKRIARALSQCDAESLEAVTDVFVEAHYPLRLASDVFCKKCKARNTVDAPHVREFELGLGEGIPAATSDDANNDSTNNEDADADIVVKDRERGKGRAATPTALPKLADFVDLAHEIADPLIAEIPGEKVELLVEDGTPDVDDGGEPLLGCYVPPPPKDAPVPMQPPRVTIYYRTFEKIEREEGHFDWEGELRETIEHELEHHVFYLRGDDPMDEEEHAEIDREVVRVVGRHETTRRTLAVFGLSVPDFFKRAWLFVLIAAVALAISLAEGRCTGAS